MKFYLTELNSLKGDTSIYFENRTLFEKKKKIFTEKNKIFVKIIRFFLKMYLYFFQIVLLHVNNHIYTGRFHNLLNLRVIHVNNIYQSLLC